MNPRIHESSDKSWRGFWATIVGASLDFKIGVPWKGDLEVINTGQKESTFAVIELLYILYIPEVKTIWWLQFQPLGKIMSSPIGMIIPNITYEKKKQPVMLSLYM